MAITVAKPPRDAKGRFVRTKCHKHCGFLYPCEPEECREFLTRKRQMAPHSPWIVKPDVIDFALATSQGNWRKAYSYAAERRQAESLAAVREGINRWVRTRALSPETSAVWALEVLTTQPPVYPWRAESADELLGHIRQAWRDQHA